MFEIIIAVTDFILSILTDVLKFQVLGQPIFLILTAYWLSFAFLKKAFRFAFPKKNNQ